MNNTFRFQKELNKFSKISEDKAVKLAKKALSEKGWDIEKYIMKKEESDEKWIITFEGKEPRPPGDEMTIYVIKKDGSIKVFIGE